MTNLLLNGVPDHIVVCDQAYFIKTDFREWIQFESLMMKEKDNGKKIKAIIDVFIDEVPRDIKFIEKILWFYRCGEGLEKKYSKLNSSQVRVYDFEQDQYLIYTAFKQYYGVDLIKDNLHWWIFKQMFLELPDESKMKKIMSYRAIQLNPDMTKEQRQFYAEMKHLYALHDNRTETEKARSFGAILAGGMHIKE